ncbi:kinesin-II 85 kDa subunit-like isoform X2 [Sitophilus oryzae]|nr:kinesin-II 85 kDa subunit-like isoform X2 [Sitophilus oryzae]
MTGSSKKYKYRGIIPRCLEYIFSNIEQTQDKPTTYISYIEIYNEICYDLLNPKQCKVAAKLEELPRVVIFEDKKGEPHMRNVSVLTVATQEEAMRLLFLGETNRAIAETPLNEYSSRSHCIFTMYLSSRQTESQKLRHSKLNFVDLAGSERVYKSKITGAILTEAKHINKSLHFLQQVILALSQSKRAHIPYRNSVMTFVLKDSLAGNCLTVMLATLSLASKNIQESISTCKFAQRVSMIKTEPFINEIEDPYQEIVLLRNEIEELKRQLRKNSSKYINLNEKNIKDDEKMECENLVDTFITSSNPDFNFERKLIGYCMQLMRKKIKLLEKEINSTKEKTKLDDDLPNVEFSKAVESRKGLETEILSENYSARKYSTENNSKEILYYENMLSSALKKAKVLSETIEECQSNINYIKTRMEKADINERLLLTKDLEYQQKTYKRCILGLKELKNETIQLEFGLNKAKTKLNEKSNFQEPDILILDEHHSNPHKDNYSAENISNGHYERQHCFNSSHYEYNCNDYNLNWNNTNNKSVRSIPVNYSDTVHSLNPMLHQYTTVNSCFNEKTLCSCSSNQCLYTYKNKHTSTDDACALDLNCNYKSDFSKSLPQCNCFYQKNQRVYNHSRSENTCNDCYELENIKPNIKKHHLVTSDNAYDKIYATDFKTCKCNKCDVPENYGFTKTVVSAAHDDHEDCSCPRNDSVTLPAYTQCNNIDQYNLDVYETDRKNRIIEKRGASMYDKSEHTVKVLLDEFDEGDNVTFDNIQYLLTSPHCDEKDLDNIKDESKSQEDIIYHLDEENNNNTLTALRCEEQQVVKKQEEATIIQKSVVDHVDDENNIKYVKKYEIFLDSDSKEFIKFMETIPLTGDEETDKEICNFYRSKFL